MLCFALSSNKFQWQWEDQRGVLTSIDSLLVVWQTAICPRQIDNHLSLKRQTANLPNDVLVISIHLSTFVQLCKVKAVISVHCVQCTFYCVLQLKLMDTKNPVTTQPKANLKHKVTKKENLMRKQTSSLIPGSDLFINYTYLAKLWFAISKTLIWDEKFPVEGNWNLFLYLRWKEICYVHGLFGRVVINN